MKIVITGGCGFLGSNLTAYGIKGGHEIIVFDNLSRVGAAQNLEWLRTMGAFQFIHGDTRCKGDVDHLIRTSRPDAVFHLAGQVAMTTSIENPYKDFETNTLGTVNMLEAIRRYNENTAMFFSSTNKVYGDLEQYTYLETEKRYICQEYPGGFDERVPLDFRSPYGCSKGAADQYMLDYGRIFGLKTVVFRHSSMYGSRQFATYDQGWIGWFCAKALEKYKNPHCAPFTISGNGKQVRDILHADDMARLYYTALENIDKVAGQAYNIGGTMKQSLSLLELFDMLENEMGGALKLEYVQNPPRISDQKIFVADISRIQSVINWEPQVSAADGISRMINWLKEK